MRYNTFYNRTILLKKEEKYFSTGLSQTGPIPQGQFNLPNTTPLVNQTILMSGQENFSAQPCPNIHEQVLFLQVLLICQIQECLLLKQLDSQDNFCFSLTKPRHKQAGLRSLAQVTLSLCEFSTFSQYNLTLGYPYS